MMQGKVKFWNEQKGYGFITGQDGQDYFCHVSGVLNRDARGRKYLEKDQEVYFDLENQPERGPKAVNVQ